MHFTLMWSIYLYVKFEVASFYTLEVMPWTKIQSWNLQRTTTPNIDRTELWFLYIELHLNVIYLYVKFEGTTLNTFEVMPWTRFRDAQTDGQGDSCITPPPKKKKLFVAV